MLFDWLIGITQIWIVLCNCICQTWFAKVFEALSDLIKGKRGSPGQFSNLNNQAKIVSQLHNWIFLRSSFLVLRKCQIYSREIGNLIFRLPQALLLFLDFTPSILLLIFKKVSTPCFHPKFNFRFLFRGENEEDLSSTNHTESSSSVSSQRRNAIDLVDQDIFPERKQKKNICMYCFIFSPGKFFWRLAVEDEKMKESDYSRFCNDHFRPNLAFFVHRSPKSEFAYL